MAIALGRFGDRRLEKGGSTFWLVSLRSDKLVSVCAASAVIEQAKCVLPGSYAIHASGPTK
jgi:hypothetical protein